MIPSRSTGVPNGLQGGGASPTFAQDQALQQFDVIMQRSQSAIVEGLLRNFYTSNFMAAQNLNRDLGK